MLSLAEQIKIMRGRYPAFRIVSRDDDSATWEGRIRPLCKRYRIRISYIPQVTFGETLPTGFAPFVEVIDPPLRHRPENPSVPIPHVYHNAAHPELPRLCLFDPRKDEWTRTNPVADLVPWTVDWLTCYEGWLATGVWTGGGRHGFAGEIQRCVRSLLTDHQSTEFALGNRDRFLRTALATGTLASAQAAAAASADDQ